jgi:RNA polymerase sigma factor (sigma-70 family)
LQENAANLQTLIGGYILSMGLSGSNADLLAAEIFQDVEVKTLAHADRFNPQMQPRPWFLAIAANILKRYRASTARCERFEVHSGNLAHTSRVESEQDEPDRILPPGMAGAEQTLTDREFVHERLSLVSPQDARLLGMAHVGGWDAYVSGLQLGITPGVARVHLHRAIGRLRVAWKTSELQKGWWVLYDRHI